MKKYRSKPVEIEAIQFKAILPDELMLDSRVKYSEKKGIRSPYLIIQTPEGNHQADFGDWIIRGLEGELYPCKDSVFQKKYEVVE